MPPERPVAPLPVQLAHLWQPSQARPESLQPAVPLEEPLPSQQRTMRHYQEKYAKPIAVWHQLEAANAAHMRDFAAAMHLNEASAYKLLCEMERLHLIQWERRKRKAL